MTRRGKIARLPRHIREELNRRLENGEQAIRLVEWLNTLPEVKEILKSDFGDHPITDGNLSEWKNGGFLEWQAQRERFADLDDLNAEGDELAKTTSKVAKNMEAVVLARYATLLHRSRGEIPEQLRATLQCYSKSLRDITRYRRCEQSRERTQIQRESLELKRARAENRKSKPVETPQEPEITQEEKDRRLKEWIYPRHLFPEKYEDEQTQSNENPPNNQPTVQVPKSDSIRLNPT